MRHDASRGVAPGSGGLPLAPKDGDWLAEYKAMREAVGIVERGDLTRLHLWGRDPVRMLDGLITNDLASASAERAVYGVMLTPKGRIITDLRAFVGDSADRPQPQGTEGHPQLGSGAGTSGSHEVFADIPEAAAEEVREHLKKYVPPMFARWEFEPNGTLGVYGPQAVGVLEATLGGTFDAHEDRVASVAYRASRVTAISTRIAGGEPGFDVTGPPDILPSLSDDLLQQAGVAGGRAAGLAALEALRIEAGRPRFGAELTLETLPAEAFETTGQMERAISFTKGCYTGQEVVVRIAHRGHVNRTLRGFLLGGAPPPAPATRLYHAETGKEVGWITASTFSPLMEQSIALGYVRRESAPGDSVRLGAPDGPRAQVVELPFTADR